MVHSKNCFYYNLLHLFKLVTYAIRIVCVCVCVYVCVCVCGWVCVNVIIFQSDIKTLSYDFKYDYFEINC